MIHMEYGTMQQGFFLRLTMEGYDWIWWGLDTYMVTKPTFRWEEYVKTFTGIFLVPHHLPVGQEIEQQDFNFNFLLSMKRTKGVKEWLASTFCFCKT